MTQEETELLVMAHVVVPYITDGRYTLATAIEHMKEQARYEASVEPWIQKRAERDR